MIIQQLFPIYILKENKDILYLLWIIDGNKQHYVYVKDFKKFMYNQTKHHRWKHFCIYCL